MTLFKSRFLFPITILVIPSGYSQYSIPETAGDTDGPLLAFDNVLLLQAKDSTLFLGAPRTTTEFSPEENIYVERLFDFSQRDLK